jgi:hypothetical protein
MDGRLTREAEAAAKSEEQQEQEVAGGDQASPAGRVDTGVGVGPSFALRYELARWHPRLAAATKGGGARRRGSKPAAGDEDEEDEDEQEEAAGLAALEVTDIQRACSP